MSGYVEVHHRGRLTDDGVVIEWYVLDDESNEAVVVRTDQALATNITDAERASKRLGLVPEWRVGLAIEAGKNYRHDGVTYTAVQSHTAAAHWAPNLPGLAALWTVTS